MGDDDKGSVLEGVTQDNDFFKQMLDLIPATIYFDQVLQKQVTSYLESHKTGKNKKRKNSTHVPNPVNPFVVKSVSQLFTDVEKCQEDGEAYLEEEEEDPDNNKFDPDKYTAVDTTVTQKQQGTREGRRALLQAKIAELQAKRNCSKGESKRKKSKKKKDDVKQGVKQEGRKKKQKKGLIPSQTGATKDLAGKRPKMTSVVRKSEGEMVFSKFDFTPKQNSKTDLKGKDYKRLLEKIEKRNEKIQKLKVKDEGAADDLKEKFKWQSVLQKAEGVKVKDNPELLEKALKRKEKMKKQRKKKWKDREANVKRIAELKQTKRKKNIQDKRQAKIEKKIKKGKKKGRIIPGF